ELVTENPKKAAEIEEEKETRQDLADTTTHTFEELLQKRPEIARSVERLSQSYGVLIRKVDPIIENEGIYSRGSMDIWLSRVSFERVFEYEVEINSKYLYEAKHLRIWLDKVIRALTNLGFLLNVLKEKGGRRVNLAIEWDSERNKLLTQAQQLSETQFMQHGKEVREQEERTAAHEARIAGAVEWITDYVIRTVPGNKPEDLRIHGPIIAGKLVHKMRLNSDEIRATFDRLKEESPEIFNASLYGGSTIWSLLSLGVSGLHEYRAIGEGFLSGLSRGERESLLVQKPGQRTFSITEKFIAFGGFVAGVFQGIGDSLKDNVKSIVSIFTIKFWSDLKKFIKEELPKMIEDEEYRFTIGMMMGQMNADEERRLATAEPFEYGRTVGHIFGMALTETVLSFIGLGWVLKAVQASPRLMRLLAPLMKLAERLAKTSIVAKGLRVVDAVSEGINALRRKLWHLRNRLPRFTAAGRAEKALAQADEDMMRSLKKVENLEATAGQALATGDIESAKKHAEDMDKAMTELEEKIANYEMQAGGISEAEVASAGEKRAAKEGGRAAESASQGPVPLTSALIGQGDELAKALNWKKPLPGWYDFVVHGTSDSFDVFHNGKWVKINHRDIARYMKKTGYRGESIRLISCSSGGGKSPIAQDLANKLGVDVLAPTDKLWIDPKGNMTIGQSQHQNTGIWELFKPGGGVKAEAGARDISKTTESAAKSVKIEAAPYLKGEAVSAAPTAERYASPTEMEEIHQRGEDLLKIFEERQKTAMEGSYSEELLKQVGGKETTKPRLKRQPRHLELGLDVHAYAEALDDWVRQRIESIGTEELRQLFPEGRFPSNLEREFKIELPNGKKYRIDGVDLSKKDSGVLYEIKSNMDGQRDIGQNKLDNVYLPIMEKIFPNRKWTTKVLIYDREVAERLLFGD
ncbi:MAG TPA: hypothetical protein VN316_00400, partial [candidate division Zixibacteria bacterium]|nr:hypothetical protein [candidate division Zixibacteria bacterium]